MRLIDAEEAFCNDCAFRDKCEEVTYCVVKNAPIIEYVPVVRCKECKMWDSDPDTYGDSIGPKGKCMKSFETMLCDDFCSYGERRAENG